MRHVREITETMYRKDEQGRITVARSWHAGCDVSPNSIETEDPLVCQ